MRRGRLAQPCPAATSCFCTRVALVSTEMVMSRLHGSAVSSSRVRSRSRGLSTTSGTWRSRRSRWAVGVVPPFGCHRPELFGATAESVVRWGRSCRRAVPCPVRRRRASVADVRRRRCRAVARCRGVLAGRRSPTVRDEMVSVEDSDGHNAAAFVLLVPWLDYVLLKVRGIILSNK